MAVCILVDQLGQSSESSKSVFKETYFLKSTGPKVPAVKKQNKNKYIWQFKHDSQTLVLKMLCSFSFKLLNKTLIDCQPEHLGISLLKYRN